MHAETLSGTPIGGKGVQPYDRVGLPRSSFRLVCSRGEFCPARWFLAKAARKSGREKVSGWSQPSHVADSAGKMQEEVCSFCDVRRLKRVEDAWRSL